MTAMQEAESATVRVMYAVSSLRFFDRVVFLRNEHHLGFCVVVHQAGISTPSDHRLEGLLGVVVCQCACDVLYYAVGFDFFMLLEQREDDVKESQCRSTTATIVGSVADALVWAPSRRASMISRMSTPIDWRGRQRSGSRLLRAKRRAPLATEDGTDFTESGLPRFGSLSRAQRY